MAVPLLSVVMVCRRQEACGAVSSFDHHHLQHPPPHCPVPNRRRAAVSRPRGPRTYTDHHRQKQTDERCLRQTRQADPQRCPERKMKNESSTSPHSSPFFSRVLGARRSSSSGTILEPFDFTSTTQLSLSSVMICVTRCGAGTRAAAGQRQRPSPGGRAGGGLCFVTGAKCQLWTTSTCLRRGNFAFFTDEAARGTA